MRAYRLGDLIADAVHRVQARERILEDHRDVLAADVAHLGRRQGQEVAALRARPRPLIRARSRLSSPMIARLVTLFPEPDSPTMPSVSPRWSVKDRSETALHDAVERRKHDRQVAHVEQRSLRHAYRTRGSRKA